MSIHTKLSFLCLCLLLGLSSTARAWFPRVAEQQRLSSSSGGSVGALRPYIVASGETFMEIARRAHLGYNAVSNLNPQVDPWAPPAGSEIELPYQALVPAGYPVGITINLAEYRLYLINEEEGVRRVRVYPIGLGREGWQSPVGDFSIVSKAQDPVWTRPDSLRHEGVPAVIEAGPDNPLGRFWLGLSIPGYGIHGTNKPYGIGRRVSHGCIRLYPADIQDLVARVKIGTLVRIVYQPVKTAVIDGRIITEVHPDYLQKFASAKVALQEQLAETGADWQLDTELTDAALRLAQGVPVVIGSIKAKGPGVMTGP